MTTKQGIKIASGAASTFLSILLISTILLTAHWYFMSTIFGQLRGFSDVAELVSTLARPALMIAGTFFGILFSLIIKALQANTASDEGDKLVQKRHLLLASFLSPLVLSAVYAQLSTIQSTWLIVLVSYQNGFFWETLISGTKSTARTRKS